MRHAYEGYEKTAVLEEVLSRVDDPDWFDFLAGQVYSFLEPTHRVRLERWLTLFSENYVRAMGLYSAMVESLLKAAQHNELFKSQTQYEFEISRDFYIQLLGNQEGIEINHPLVADQLLNISLVLAKYPGMQLRSLRSGFTHLSGLLLPKNVHDLFAHLFVKYDNPRLLSANLNYLKANDLEGLMFVLQGHSLRNYPSLPVPLSRKEAALLVKLPAIPFDNEVLRRVCLAAKTVGKSEHYNFLSVFLPANKLFQWQLDLYAEKIEFWKDAYAFLAQIDWEEELASPTDLIDYFEHLSCQPGYSFKGRTLSSVLRAMFDWHDHAQRQEAAAMTWMGSGKEEIALFSDGARYVFREITRGEELFAEGDALKHCVSSYLWACSMNHCSIWSMKKEHARGFQPYLTIEARGQKIVQVAGLRNKKPTKEDIDLIEEWASMLGLKWEG